MSKSDEHRSKSDTSMANEHWSNSMIVNERARTSTGARTRASTATRD